MSGPRAPDPDAGGLEEVRQGAFALLSRAVADRRSPMHTVTLATAGLDGRPRLRTVVFRAFDAVRRELRIHTDLRSAKVDELRRDPRFAMLAYDPGRKVQLRIEGKASLHHGDAVADAAWAASQPMSRQCYGTEPGPGTPIGHGGDFTLPMSPEEVEAGRAHFVAVLGRIETLDWLYLAHGGHRRARFDWGGDADEPNSTWRVP